MNPTMPVKSGIFRDGRPLPGADFGSVDARSWPTCRSVLQFQIIFGSAAVVVAVSLAFEVGVFRGWCRSSRTAVPWLRRVFLARGPAFGGGLLSGVEVLH